MNYKYLNFHKNMSKKPNRIVALLPIKANSVRIKRKNFRNFCGKPLFQWIIDTLLSIQEVSLIVINTDARGALIESGLQESDRILIRDRKKEICGDQISMNRVIEDDIANVPADIYLMTHVTNPLLSSNTISNVILTFFNALAQGEADSLFTVNKFQTRFYKKDCSPINHNMNILTPTQELEPWYEENSNLYIFTSNSFLKNNTRIGSKPLLYENPKIESIDIDNYSDWEFAEVSYLYMQNEAKKRKDSSKQ